MKWNEVTWYSKLAAIIFFLGIFPVLTFYIGMQYQRVQDLNNTPSLEVKEEWRTFVSNEYHFTFKYPPYLQLNEIGGFDQVSYGLMWPQSDESISDILMIVRPNYGGYFGDIDNEVLSQAIDETIAGVPVKKLDDTYYFVESPIEGFNSLEGEALTIANIEKFKPTQIELYTGETIPVNPGPDVRKQVMEEILSTFEFVSP
jgi:hypothetical protein